MNSEQLKKCIKESSKDVNRLEIECASCFEFIEEYPVCIGLYDATEYMKKYGGVTACTKQPLAEIGIKPEERLVIRTYNEGGYNGTDIDLLTFLKWIKTNHPEILDEI